MWIQNGQLIEKSEIKNTSFTRVKNMIMKSEGQSLFIILCHLHIFLRYEMFITEDSEIKMVKYQINDILI